MDNGNTPTRDDILCAIGFIAWVIAVTFLPDVARLAQ
jgi:hypothetical protein